MDVEPTITVEVLGFLFFFDCPLPPAGFVVVFPTDSLVAMALRVSGERVIGYRTDECPD